MISKNIRSTKGKSSLPKITELIVKTVRLQLTIKQMWKLYGKVVLVSCVQ
jgi:hypothetical protein